MSNSWLALQRGIAGHEAAGPNLARELHSGKRARTIGRNQVRSPELSGTEGDAEKVAHPGGTTSVRTTQGLGGTGVWSQQRNLRQFRTRGQARVAAEFTLAALAYNLTRMFHRRLQL